MKKISLFVSILAVIAAAVLGVTVATASAATCTLTSGNPGYHPTSGGNVVWNAVASNCTGVDKVKFVHAGTGMDDTSFHPETNPGADTILSVVGGQAGQSFYLWCWYVGAVHTVDTVSVFSLHNSATNTWGTNHVVHSALQAFAC